MPRPLIETTRGWRDKTMVDHEGVPLGRITHIYLEEVTGEPEWAPVATGEDRRVFVPLVDATEWQDQVRVPSSGRWSPTPQSSGPVGSCPRRPPPGCTATAPAPQSCAGEVPGGCRGVGQPLASGRG
jgi:hypothetical protein